MSVPCRTCTAPVIWLPIYNGQTRPFDTTVYTEGSHDVVERWYVRRNPLVAVPEDIAGTHVRPESDYLIEHRCTGRRQGIFTVSSPEDTANTRLDRARRTGPFARDLPLTDQYCIYTYRWPSSWAHIVHHGYTAICGARMHGEIRTRPTEREHVKTMPVCPDCITTYKRNYRNAPESEHTA